MQSEQRGGRAPARFCAANTRKGTPCKRGRGWGTDHPGYGNCKRHGGATPSGKAAAAKEAAAASAMADYAGEVQIAPLDALLYTVRRGAQLVAYWQRRALETEEGEARQYATEQEARALQNLNHWANNAVKSGVAKAQVEIAARLADHLIASAEEALAALELAVGRSFSAGERTAFASAYGRSLERLEQGTIEATARGV